MITGRGHRAEATVLRRDLPHRSVIELLGHSRVLVWKLSVRTEKNEGKTVCGPKEKGRLESRP